MKNVKRGFFSSINMKIQLVFGAIYIIVLTGLGFGIFMSLSAGFDKQYRLEIENTTELIYQLTSSYVDTSVQNYLIGLAEAVKRMAEYEYQRYLDGEQTEEEAWARTRKIMLDPVFGKINAIPLISGSV